MDLSPRTRLILILAVVILVAVGLGLAWAFRESIPIWLVTLRDWLEIALELVPLWLFAILLMTLPVIGFPVSILYLAASGYGIAAALPMVLITMVVNQWLTWILVRTIFRPPVERFLERSKLTVPRVSRESEAEVALMIRATPGLPYAIQGFLLSLTDMRFRTYLIISMAVQGPFAIAVVVLGQSILEGRGAMAVLAILAFLALTAVARLLYKKVRRRRGDPTHETASAG